MSINSLSSSSTVLTIYLRTHINTVNSLLLHFATLFNAYLTKSLPHINPNLTILGKTCILYNFFFHYICWQFLPIMLALYSMLLPPYYAQNYAGIIGSSLFMMVKIHVANLEQWVYNFLRSAGIKSVKF